jgi:cytochrome oxidase assembly protein ShyY1
MTRWPVAVLAAALLVLGTWDLGRRADARTLTMAECLRTESLCDARVVSIPHHPIAAVEGELVVLEGRGYRVELAGVPVAQRTTSAWAHISVQGVWRSGARVEVQRVLVHPLGRLKLAVGAGSLLLTIWFLVGFVRRRLRA